VSQYAGGLIFLLYLLALYLAASWYQGWGRRSGDDGG
jgi:hypothetical protein